jgi:MFS transporter, CP family, cyanate transporter
VSGWRDRTVSPAAPPPPTAGGGRRRLRAALFLAGMLALAFNLRAAITSLPPVFPELAASLRLSSAALAVLAAAPVFCFAVFSGVAAPLSRRFGEERVLLASLLLLAAGLAARGAAPGSLLFPGTVVAAGAIAFMNVLLPSLVKRRWPARAGLLIGVYLLFLALGAIIGSLAAVPLFQATGGSLVVTLGVWALPAAAAALVWLPQRRYRTVPVGAGGRGDGPARVKVTRHLLAWQVMGFMGLQSLTYYATLSWLPVLFRDRGTSAVTAGVLLALMNLGNAVTALVMPVLAHRVADHRGLVAGTMAASAAGLAGVWFAPLAGAAAWTVLLGLGQGASLGLAIYFTAARAPDPVTSASLSAFTQGAGYLVATAGPVLTGVLHSATGSWTPPVLALLAILLGQFATGWLAGRDRVLPAGAPA